MLRGKEALKPTDRINLCSRASLWVWVWFLLPWEFLCPLFEVGSCYWGGHSYISLFYIIPISPLWNDLFPIRYSLLSQGVCVCVVLGEVTQSRPLDTSIYL